MLSHEYIWKSNKEKTKDGECHWLVRSPETTGFDLLDVDISGKWEVWLGKIASTDVSIKCNLCSDESDCNLNGDCVNGICVCDDGPDADYFGTHCEVVLEKTCSTIVGEKYNDRWTVGDHFFFSEIVITGLDEDAPFQEYSRPVYSYQTGSLPDELAPNNDQGLSLIYSGSRWYMITIQGVSDVEYWKWQTSNYHALWARAFSPGVTTMISDSTTNDNPVGVDFNIVGERGNQFGAFGLLYPAMVNNETGRGLFRCDVNRCSFCESNALLKNTTIPENYTVFPSAAGLSCLFLYNQYAQSLEEGHDCDRVKLTEPICCPTKV